MPKNEPLWYNRPPDEEPTRPHISAAEVAARQRLPKSERWWSYEDEDDRMVIGHTGDRVPVRGNSYYAEWITTDFFMKWFHHKNALDAKKAGKPYDPDNIIPVMSRPWNWLNQWLCLPYYGENHRGSPW